MTVQEAGYFVLNQLRTRYDEGEASQVTDWIMEFVTGSKKTERMLYKNAALTPAEETQIRQYTERVMQQEPLQYVLNEAWFCGLRFYVDKNVLIPRPETEELVEWIITHCKFPVDELKILDIGTGSGCIAVSLKRRLRKAEVWGCDISPAALVVAQKNAAALGTAINFILMDFLDETQRENLPEFDIIVSNPPYVPEKDALQMSANVLNHEPAAALFVPDDNPLLFYQAMIDFAAQHLHPSGSLYAEMHENLGEDVLHLFKTAGYAASVKKDMLGKDRMLKAARNSKS